MPELDGTLRALAAELHFPEEPDLVPAVRARIAGASRPRTFAFPLRRRAAALALAAVLGAVAVAFAVPPARTAILEVFGVGGVEVELVERLPERPVQGRLVLGDRVSLAEARQRVAFPVAVPQAEGFDDPDAVYVSNAVPGRVIFLLYGSEVQPRALLTQFETGQFPFVEKSVTRGTTLRRVEVNGLEGAWIAGEPHQFTFENQRGQIQAGSLRLATNTLVWERDGVTLRLEGRLSLREALRIARSLE
jgi:hypothetical protein